MPHRSQQPQWTGFGLQKGYITVTVLEAPEAPRLEGCVFRCTTCDLSSSGLQLIVHSHVPMNSKLRIVVEFVDPLATFDHTATVAWCREHDAGIVQSYALGMKFTDTESQTGHAWADMLKAHMLGAKAPPRYVGRLARDLDDGGSPPDRRQRVVFCRSGYHA